VPTLELKGEGQRLFEQMGATRIHLSLSHTTEHAVAQVIFEKV
jgi:phosphopantetheinyl transferase (holo-ACP synthase)